MKIKSILLALFVVGLLSSCQPRLIRVLSLGDSITQGKAKGDSITELSYRYWLWEKLDSAGYRVDMVGTNPFWFNGNNLQNQLVSPYTSHVFDTDHEAFYGIKTGATLNGGFTHDGVPYDSLNKRLRQIAAPDYAFVHIGTNDGKEDSLATIHSLKQIVEELYLRNRGMHIFLAKLNTPWVHFVNNAIEPVVAEMKRVYPNIKLTFVDMAAGWINCPEATGTMTFDWVHPNVAGQKVMADRWFKAFRSAGDKRNPTFKGNIGLVEKTDSTATITWSEATDNRFIAGYDVLLDGRKVNWHRSACGGKRNEAIAFVTETTFQLTGLTKGAMYSVQVTAWDYANNSQTSKPFTIKME